MPDAQLFRIRRGLDLPIKGEPQQIIESGSVVRSVGVLGSDYAGMKPTMMVKSGDQVSLGQPLFEDKKNPGVFYTAPGAGTVTAVNRGEKRRLVSVVIALDGSNREKTFRQYSGGELRSLSRTDIQKNLIDSGLWTALRTRPYDKVPQPDSLPHAVFITAIDTNPLAADPAIIINEHANDFENGLKVVSRLTEGKVYLCQVPEKSLPGGYFEFITPVAFEGPHPAGLVGTHVHLLDPVGRKKMIWHIGYQDVIAIGKLFTTGKIWTDRVVALGGPAALRPRLVKTRVGANITDLVANETKDGNVRPISGSVLWGHKGSETMAYLGRYHTQVSLIEEGTKREFLGWQKPGFDKFSVRRLFASSSMPWKKFAFTSSTEGSKRAMVPIGTYEDVVPLDIVPTYLLRALIVSDFERAQELGCLELGEEDLGLCTFVCPGKYNYAPLLRKNLEIIEKEG